MKIFYRSLCLLHCCLFWMLNSFGQTPPTAEFSFVNYSRVSGTPLSVGAVYRFTNVATGTDALVTIASAAGGATLDTLDQLGAGYAPAFQPLVRVPAGKTGYIEFSISFVKAGTSTLMTPGLMHATALDIDGNATLKEFDEINMGSSAAMKEDPNSSEITVTKLAGNYYHGENIAGVEYTGIDLSEKVRFTVSALSVNSLIVRSGAKNTGTAAVSRQRSIYFADFPYLWALPLPELNAFAATRQSEYANVHWAVSSSDELQNFVLEQSHNGSDFAPIATLNTTTALAYNYTDKMCGELKNYYRLKIVSKTGTIRYSEVTAVNALTTQQNLRLKAYGTTRLINLTTESNKATSATIILTDFSGQPVACKTIQLQTGFNHVSFPLELSHAGVYLVTLKTAETAITNRIFLIE